MKQVIAAALIWLGTAICVFAQELVWIQVEAQPNLRAAEDRVRSYATRLPDVAGFQQSSNWYVIALGPYDRDTAEGQLRTLRVLGEIPRDSFIARSSAYRSQFWPIGQNALAATAPVTPAAPAPTPQVESNETTAAAPEPDAPVAVPDETLREARASESRLTRDEKKELQVALQWAGFYRAAIDGSYGRGTRAAMREWQEFKGLEPTGVLTTRQRATLLRDYNAVLEGMDIATVTDAQAGIQIDLPLGVMAFEQYEPPFAHYRPTGDVTAHVSLISQPGSDARFRGLYNVLQTLDMVPTDGPRKLNRSSFQIEGQDDRYHTTVEVRFERGEMKGFMFVWPAGDDQRRTRVLDAVRASFTPIPGVLNPDLVEPTEDQSVDLLAGLEVRQPAQTATGFFVDGAGTVLTHAAAIDNCGRVSIFGETDMDVVFADSALGLAALRPQSPTAPISYATFQGSVPRLKSEVLVAGYSFGGLLGAPTLTTGSLEDLRGLGGEDTVKRLAIETQPGDAGGPVFDGGGKVLGLLQPMQDGARKLPNGVGFAVDTDTIRARLQDAGIVLTEGTGTAAISPIELETMAADMTVLVECWQ
ncbi:serine protease [Shimia ponticola]|uniref:serine protease n=1 Tax=Shimia ponticola TaxID=2582893 RepID=UPI0011BD56B2|nr:serine protease [Shimia ponticola]